MQHVHPLRVVPDGIGTGLLELTKRWQGVSVVSEGPFPIFPKDYAPEIKLHYGDDGQHHCDINDEDLYPGGALVFETGVNSEMGRWYYPDKHFCPYYIAPVLVFHEGRKPDPAVWRMLVTTEAVSFLTQNPSLKTLRYYSANCTRGCCQLRIEANRIYASCGFTHKEHHAAYTLRSIKPPYGEMRENRH